MRLRAITLSAALLLVVAACGGDGGGGETATDGELPECPVTALDTVTEPVEVVVWHTQAAKALETLQVLVDQYNSSQSKVRVRIESQGSDYEELERKFEASVPTRDLPALLMFDDTATQTMVDSDVILPAQSCIDADDYDMSGFLEVARNYYTIDDAIWPASANLGNALLFYNRNHFRAAGLDPNDPPQTLAEVREDAEKIKAAGVVDTPLVHEFSSWKTEFWLTGDRADMVNNDNGRGGGETTAAAFTDGDSALELFTWFKDMQSAGLLRAVSHTTGQIDQYLAMANEQASMLIETSSAATSIEAFLGGNLDISALDQDAQEPQNVSGIDMWAAVFPGLSAPGKTQMGGAAWYMTNTTAPEVQAGAWDFMKFMNTAESQGQMLIGGSYLPYRLAANDLPAVQQFYAGGLSGRWLKIANDQVQAIDPTFPGPLIGPYYDFRRAVEKAQDQLMLGGASPEAALQQAQDDVTAALDLYNQEGF